jgi:hypothetical protein
MAHVNRKGLDEVVRLARDMADPSINLDWFSSAVEKYFEGMVMDEEQAFVLNTLVKIIQNLSGAK